MRAVIDTNVLVSGLFWHGAPHGLVEEIRSGRLTLLSSPILLAELAEVLDRPKIRAVINRSGIDPIPLLSELRQLAEIIDPPPLLDPVSRDPDDDAVLALAEAARADLIISGDADLLALVSHADIRIVDPATALAEIRT